MTPSIRRRLATTGFGAATTPGVPLNWIAVRATSIMK
jgi:hypothetical protein